MLVTFIATVLLAALILIVSFPETSTARWLRRYLVDAPAQFLLNFTLAKLGKTLLVGIAFVLLALAGPEIAVLLAATGLDTLVFVELMILASVTAVAGGVRSSWRAFKSAVTHQVQSLAKRVLNRRRRRAPRRRVEKPTMQGFDHGDPSMDSQSIAVIRF